MMVVEYMGCRQTNCSENQQSNYYNFVYRDIDLNFSKYSRREICEPGRSIIFVLPYDLMQDISKTDSQKQHVHMLPKYCNTMNHQDIYIVYIASGTFYKHIGILGSEMLALPIFLYRVMGIQDDQWACRGIEGIMSQNPSTKFDLVAYSTGAYPVTSYLRSQTSHLERIQSIIFMANSKSVMTIVVNIRDTISQIFKQLSTKDTLNLGYPLSIAFNALMILPAFVATASSYLAFSIIYIFYLICALIGLEMHPYKEFDLSPQKLPSNLKVNFIIIWPDHLVRLSDSLDNISKCPRSNIGSIRIIHPLLHNMEGDSDPPNIITGAHNIAIRRATIFRSIKEMTNANFQISQSPLTNPSMEDAECVELSYERAISLRDDIGSGKISETELSFSDLRLYIEKLYEVPDPQKNSVEYNNIAAS